MASPAILRRAAARGLPTVGMDHVALAPLIEAQGTVMEAEARYARTGDEADRLRLEAACRRLEVLTALLRGDSRSPDQGHASRA